MPAALAERIETYLTVLLTHTRSADASTRLRSFEGILALAEIRRDSIMHTIDSTIPAAIAGLQDENKDVAKTACNFFLEFISDFDQEEFVTRMQSLSPYLKE